MKRNYNYSPLPYKVFNLSEICSKYEKLSMLKEALGLGEDREMNEDLMFELVSEHNCNEFYLLEYIINKTIFAPREIKVQNSLLIRLYDRPEKYKKQYEATKEAYRNEYIFKKFANSIREDLHLQDKYNCELFNYQVYELCSKYINNRRILEPQEVHLNLHFIQKWIFEQAKIELEPFTDVEKEIICCLADGFRAYKLAERNLIKGEKDNDFLNAIIYEILPAKCQVETINQVMATICCRCSNPAKTKLPLPWGGN